MSATDQKGCQDQAGHTLHLCQLKKKGLADEIAARTSDPAFICHNCNGAANRSEDLCNPSPFPRRA